MGQAFRRASGRIKASSPNIEPMASSKPKTVVDRQPPVVGPTNVSKISRAVDIDAGQLLFSFFMNSDFYFEL